MATHPQVSRLELAGSPPVRIEPCLKRVRVLFGGATVVDSRRTAYLFERGHVPVYYFPREDVRTDLLAPSEKRTRCPVKGEASYWSIRVGDRTANDAVWSYPAPIDGCPDISGLVAFYWNRVDHWLEEDEEVFAHPRDPYHRIDVLHSSRHVSVVVGGTTVAKTHRPRVLFETGLPVRHYIPKLDVRMDLLVPSETVTVCAYKGRASHFHVKLDDRLIRDVAWSYPFPNPELFKIQDLICFYDERAEAVVIDGEAMTTPETPWSRP
ncbi:MAG: DUF427 domain-containing protein [Anaeromyxobacteraceae bacterium]